MEHDHLWWNFPLNMVIFHSYVSYPEGNDNLGVIESSAFLW